MTEDALYYYRRAERELAMARQAVVPEASKAHYTLAGHYLDRVYGGPQGDRTLPALSLPPIQA
ncbi:hypothetical protein SAMN05192583_2776 [Sphingomonas gellani]|uniref:Uncharacterized protein n=1 Tax=Sphingomonas gellani TaxID=1166340 RepID=A0A1H8GIV2_9SPHN|nr:hypothetical protein [Sphingomonas gellani]SEN43729.1 hypothetical protein SAMN05192583_2776 [Sphingomonas gellani]